MIVLYHEGGIIVTIHNNFREVTMLDDIHLLFDALHAHPEISGHEKVTRTLLIDFIKKHTSLSVHDCGSGFYAAHREENTCKSALALRADYDALAMPDGTAKHLCGHDGQAAALCGAALLSEGKTFGRNIFFLFQPAEETGAGAAECISLFEHENVDEIYGMHNLPGFPFGEIVTRPGTFACASRGMILRFTGKPTHAAYPENGISPSQAVGELLTFIPQVIAPENYGGMTLCTVIGVKMGERAFGAAAADAEVWLTLRAEFNRDLEALNSAVLSKSQELSEIFHLGFGFEYEDVFPATENTPACAAKVLSLCEGKLLPVPMRWSEDFGHYLLKCPGAYFGIGAGEDYPPLHTENYVYPCSLLTPSIEAWMKLMQG